VPVMAVYVPPARSALAIVPLAISTVVTPPVLMLISPAPSSAKLPLANVAIPLVLSSALALSIVIVLPEPLALATLNVPDKPFKLATPPEPPPLPDRQLLKLKTPPAPFVVRHWPDDPELVGKVRVKLAEDTPDCRVMTLLFVLFLSAMEPVLVLAVPSVKLLADASVNAPKVGVAEVSMFCIVLTAPLLTVKFVLLKLAIPLFVVVASSIVIAEPEPLVLLIVSAPLRPSRLVTLPAPAQLASVARQNVSLAVVTGIV